MKLALTIPAILLCSGTALAQSEDYVTLIDDYLVAESTYKSQQRRFRRSREYRQLISEGNYKGAQGLLGRNVESPIPAFVRRFREVSDKHAGKPHAARFLAWIAVHGDQSEPVKAAVEPGQGAHRTGWELQQR